MRHHPRSGRRSAIQNDLRGIQMFSYCDHSPNRCHDLRAVEFHRGGRPSPDRGTLATPEAATRTTRRSTCRRYASAHRDESILPSTSSQGFFLYPCTIQHHSCDRGNFDHTRCLQGSYRLITRFVITHPTEYGRRTDCHAVFVSGAFPGNPTDRLRRSRLSELP